MTKNRELEMALKALAEASCLPRRSHEAVGANRQSFGCFDAAERCGMGGTIWPER